jgi:electron transport complex protein RnfC
MKKVYRFPHGGVSFEDPTVPPKNAGIIAFLPVLSVVPFTQHTGGKADPLVAIGDQVQEGMLIARARGPLSANIHAPVPGKVVRTVSWEHNEGVVIRLGGGFEKLGKAEKQFPWEDLMPFALQQAVADYGIVEMEGEGQPVGETLAAFRVEPEEPATLVVRCVFDDPWLAADYALCRERFKAVVEGSVMICRSVKIKRVVYAVSHREKEIGDLFLQEAGSYDVPASLVLVGSRYPQKNRRELELVLRDYEKCEGQTLGALLIMGPATLAAVHDALKLKKPVLERYVAVGGSAVKTPRVMRVRIGTRLKDVFAECGGLVGEPQRIIMGSPLSGRQVTDLDEPVVKTSYAVAALLEHETGGTVMRSCIGCGECRMACPVELDPEFLFKGIKRGEGSKGHGDRSAGGLACHGCGCCDLVCPSRLPLSAVIYDKRMRDA